MSRTSFARAALAFAPLALVAPLSAQTYSAVLTEGDVVPGWGAVERIRGVQVNDAGDWCITVQSTTLDTVLVRGSGTMFQSGQALSAPAGATLDRLFGTSMAKGGEVVTEMRVLPASGPSIGATGYEGDTLMYEGQAVFAAGALPGSTYDGLFHNRMPIDGELYSVWNLASSSGTYSALMNIEFDLGMGLLFEQIIYRTGQVPPGQTSPIANFSGNRYSVAANESGDLAFYVILDQPGPFPTAVYRNDELFIHSGTPCDLVPGRLWQPSGSTAVEIDERGGIAYRSNLDDNSAVFAHEHRLVRRTGEAMPGFPGQTFEKSSATAVRTNRAGELLHAGRSSSSLDVGLYLEDVLLAAENNGVVLGQTVTDIYESQESLDMSPDGRYVLFIATLADGLERAVLIDRDVRPQDFCIGDNVSVLACPCGNETPTHRAEGCENSQGHGAYLTARGALEVGANDATFAMYQARPNQPGMLVQGETVTDVAFKDGVLCMGVPTERIEVVFTDANGYAETSSNISLEGNVLPFQTRYYQMWYRDPQLSVCGTGSNFTQGLVVEWN